MGSRTPAEFREVCAQMEARLVDCPRCRTKDHLRITVSVNSSPSYVLCAGCGLCIAGPEGTVSPQDAVEAWRTRAPAHGGEQSRG
jgi:transcription elongation factor Elf1